MSKRPGSVLFMCSMNSIRSPMAAAITRTLFPRSIYARSAGVRAGYVDGFVIEVMAEMDIDMATHKPKIYDELEDDYFELCITLSPDAHHQALELTRTQAIDVEYWPTPDPSEIEGRREQKLYAYRELRDHFWTKIRATFK